MDSRLFAALCSAVLLLVGYHVLQKACGRGKGRSKKMHPWKQCENPTCSWTLRPLRTPYCFCELCGTGLVEIPLEDLVDMQPCALWARHRLLEHRLGVRLAQEVADRLIKIEDAYGIELYGKRAYRPQVPASDVPAQRRLEFARYLARRGYISEELEREIEEA